MSRGYARLVADLYEPESFFDRVDDLWLRGPLLAEPGWRCFAATRSWTRLRKQARSWIEATIVAARLLLQMNDRALRRIYLGRFFRALRSRPDSVLIGSMPSGSPCICISTS